MFDTVTAENAIATSPEAEDVRLNLNRLARLVGEEGLNPWAIRAAIHNLGHSMEKLPQCEARLTHIFAEGLYGRQWSCSKDNFIVTETWKVQNISSLIKGKIAVMSEAGFQVMEAPAFFVTEPGTQRVMLMLEDTVFTTVHPNPDNERDTDKLLKRLTTVHKFEKVAGSIGTVEEAL